MSRVDSASLLTAIRSKRAGKPRRAVTAFCVASAAWFSYRARSTDPLNQKFADFVEIAVDGPDRHAEPRGDFTMIEIVYIIKRECLPTRRREEAQKLAELPKLQAAFDFGYCLAGVFDHETVRLVIAMARPHPHLAMLVDDQVGEDLIK